MYLRAMSGRSRQAAVRVNCLMCVGWNSAEVDRCYYAAGGSKGTLLAMRVTSPCRPRR